MKRSLLLSLWLGTICSTVHATWMVPTTPWLSHHHQNETLPSEASLWSKGWIQWGRPNDAPPSTPSLSPNIQVDTITTPPPPSDVPSTVQSDTPSSFLSDTPSSLPSDDPSTIPSDVPSTVFSDTPSHWSSSTPTMGTDTTFNEEAVQLGLETLDLVGYSSIQSWTNGDGDDTPKVLINGDNEYNLTNLFPYKDLFDPLYFDMDGSRVTNIRSNETFQIPIYRSMSTDGNVIQFATNEMGNISFAEIRVPDPSINDDIFYIPSEVLRSDIGEDATTSDGDRKDVLISFTNRDLDNNKFGTIFDLDEVDPPNRRHRHVRRILDAISTSVSEANTDDSTVASACSEFQIVKIAVVYDASLCSAYGSMAATRNRIISIVASASLYYERELCTKLQLVDIYTPDTSCSSSSSASFTNQFNTESACRGDSNLLDDFSNWIRSRRNAIGIDSNAIVHLLTGADKVTSTIGCAFTSSVRSQQQMVCLISWPCHTPSCKLMFLSLFLCYFRVRLILVLYGLSIWC